MFFGYSPITSIQLLWANFVVSLLGGIGVLTEPPTEELMEKLPLKQTKPLITKAMWRNIVSQALYQVTISVAFQFKGQTIRVLAIRLVKPLSLIVLFSAKYLTSKCKELEKKNVFKSIHRNHCFGFCGCCSHTAALSLGFGVKEEGLRTGWYEGSS
ncbi:calcium-transporting atpase 12 [Quercus suber]|uniref:Calcium-transporting atpase 12 n=1 Tax=Quercus suber TaxID=58331 RepID=A0AAW0L119_QUESU